MLVLIESTNIPTVRKIYARIMNFFLFFISSDILLSNVDMKKEMMMMIKFKINIHGRETPISFMKITPKIMNSTFPLHERKHNACRT